MSSYRRRAAGLALLGTAAALALAACNGGPATEPARAHAAGPDAHVASTGYYRASSPAYSSDRGARTAPDGSGAPDPRREPVALFKGKPLWAANRRHSAEENAQYQFEHDGGDFDAHTLNDFVTKVHAFVDKPPKDVLTLTRANGDRLLYDAHGNVFAVVAKDGAPRTMFKPRDGEAYWEQQKTREEARAKGDTSDSGRRYSTRKPSSSDSRDDQG